MGGLLSRSFKPIVVRLLNSFVFVGAFNGWGDLPILGADSDAITFQTANNSALPCMVDMNLWSGDSKGVIPPLVHLKSADIQLDGVQGQLTIDASMGQSLGERDGAEVTNILNPPSLLAAVGTQMLFLL